MGVRPNGHNRLGGMIGVIGLMGLVEKWIF